MSIGREGGHQLVTMELMRLRMRLRLLIHLFLEPLYMYNIYENIICMLTATIQASSSR